MVRAASLGPAALEFIEGFYCEGQSQQSFFYCTGSSGDILYAKLLKEEILQCDKELLKAAKKAGSIGGKEGSV